MSQKPAPSRERGTRRLEMNTTDKRAVATMTLELRSDRKTALHSTYCIVFTTEGGQKNDNPVTHQIRVDADLKPVVEILTPLERKS